MFYVDCGVLYFFLLSGNCHCICCLPSLVGEKTAGAKSNDPECFRVDQRRCEYVHAKRVYHAGYICTGGVPDVCHLCGLFPVPLKTDELIELRYKERNSKVKGGNTMYGPGPGMGGPRMGAAVALFTVAVVEGKYKKLAKKISM